MLLNVEGDWSVSFLWMGCDRNMCHSLYTFGVFWTNKVHMRQFSRKETNGIRVASNV